MKKEQDKSLLRYGILVGALSVPLLVSCLTVDGAQQTKEDKDRHGHSHSHEQDSHHHKDGEVDGDSLGIQQDDRNETSEATSLTKLFDFYKEEATALVEYKGITKKIEVLNSIVDGIDDLRDSFKNLKEFTDKATKLEGLLAIAKNEVLFAKENNWYVAKEIVLYLIGFKWFWGMFTGFAPTTSYGQEMENLHAVEGVIQPQLEATRKDIDDAKKVVEDNLVKVTKRFDKAIEQIGNSDMVFVKRLLTSKLLFIDVVKDLVRNLENFNSRIVLNNSRLRRVTETYATLFENENDNERNAKVKMDSAVYLEREALKNGKERFASSLKKFNNLTSSVITQTEEGAETELSFFSPVVMLSELTSTFSSVNPKVTVARSNINSQESLITESEKQAASDMVDKYVDELSEVVKQRKIIVEKLGPSYQALKALDSLREEAMGVVNKLLDLQALKAKVDVAVDRVVRAEFNLMNARKDGVSLFTELPLYVLGFKWLWGGSVNYAPTVNTPAEIEELEEAKASLERVQNEVKNELHGERVDFEHRLESFIALADSIAKSKNSALTKGTVKFFKNGFLKKLEDLRTAFKDKETKKELAAKSLLLDSKGTGNNTPGFGTFFKKVKDIVSGGSSFSASAGSSAKVNFNAKGSDLFSLLGLSDSNNPKEVYLFSFFNENKNIRSKLDQLKKFITQEEMGALKDVVKTASDLSQELQENFNKDGVLNYVIQKLSALVGNEEKMTSETDKDGDDSSSIEVIEEVTTDSQEEHNHNDEEEEVNIVEEVEEEVTEETNEEEIAEEVTENNDSEESNSAETEE